MSLLSTRLARLIAPALLAAAFAAPADDRADLARIEDAYADMNDALGAVGLIDSGYAASHAGRDGKAWSSVLEERRNAVRAGLATLRDGKLSAEDQRAVRLMREAVQPTDASAGLASVAGV